MENDKKARQAEIDKRVEAVNGDKSETLTQEQLEIKEITKILAETTHQLLQTTKWVSELNERVNEVVEVINKMTSNNPTSIL